MKILIADDQAKRYARLIDQLVALGLGRADIQLVPSANDARDKLEAYQFDLLILDVLLPVWPEGEPDVQSSLDLLFEIHESDALNRPSRILGITADASVLADARVVFEEKTWTIVKYSESNDDWMASTLAAVRYLQSGQSSGATVPSADLVVICALAKPELEQVLKLPWSWSAPEPIDDLTFVRRGKANCGSKTISVCAAAAPRMGMVATALLAARLISILKPKMIAMCGISAGVRSKVDFGDVLVVDPAWDFQSGKRIRDEKTAEFAVAPHQLPCNALVRSHLEQMRDDREWLSKVASDYDLEAPRNPRIVIGPVASGSAVLADSDIVEEIKKQHRGLVGVEMESYGLYAAAMESAAPQPSVVSIKSVCDFADPTKGDEHQRFAAYTSARTFGELIERYGDRLLR